MMCASLGCRIQEACGVKNNDVDLDKGTITLRGESTKTKAQNKPGEARSMGDIDNMKDLAAAIRDLAAAIRSKPA